MKYRLFRSILLGALLAAFSGALAYGQTTPPQALYVSNYGNNTVTMYDAQTGALLRTLVRAGSELKGANGFAIAPNGDIYIAGETTNNVVHYQARTGRLIEVLDPANIANLSAPQGVNFGPDGLLYVASMGNDRIVRFNVATGRYVDTFCVVMVPGVQNAQPIDPAFGPDKNLYVGTFAGHSLLKYQGPPPLAKTENQTVPANPPGTLLRIFGPPTCRGCNRENVAEASYASGDFASYMASSATQPGEVPPLTKRNFFVDVIDSATFSGKVVEYTQTGDFVRDFIPEGTGGLALTGGIAFGPGQNLYLANIRVDDNFQDIGSTIMRFDGKTGAPLGELVRAGAGLNIPFAMKFGPQ